MKEQLLDAGAHVISYGERLGADLVEVYLETIHALEVSVEGSELQSVAMKTDCGCGIRVVHDKRIGNAYATSLEYSIIEQAIQNAMSLARVSSRDNDFRDFPSQAETYPSVSGIVDSAILSLTPEEATDFLMRSVQSNQEQLRDFSPLNFASLHSKDITKVVMNSTELA